MLGLKLNHVSKRGHWGGTVLENALSPIPLHEEWIPEILLHMFRYKSLVYIEPDGFQVYVNVCVSFYGDAAALLSAFAMIA